MSVKIYEGWRMPVRHLNLFIDAVRKATLSKFAKAARAEMEMLSGTPQARWTQLRTGIENDSIPGLTSWMNIWISGRYAYVVGSNISGVPKWAEDYSYHDNSDEQLKTMTYRQWRARKARWQKVCTGEGTAEHNARRLCHEIVSRHYVGYDVWQAVFGPKSGRRK